MQFGNWKYGEFGPGGGSVPGWVMRAGQVAPFDPKNVRHDIEERNVENAVRIPVGYPPGVAQYGPPSAFGPPAAVSVDALGRAVHTIAMPGTPSAQEAQEAAAAIRRIAGALQRKGLLHVAPYLGMGLGALVKGGTVVLRWRNGVAVSVAGPTTA
jgi:peptidoglycan/xylan/chitin deacetylase (PgdA/CDA1 family)